MHSLRDLQSHLGPYEQLVTLRGSTQLPASGSSESWESRRRRRAGRVRGVRDSRSAPCKIGGCRRYAPPTRGVSVKGFRMNLRSMEAERSLRVRPTRTRPLPDSALVEPVRFLRTCFQPDDWIAVFLKNY